MFKKFELGREKRVKETRDKKQKLYNMQRLRMALRSIEAAIGHLLLTVVWCRISFQNETILFSLLLFKRLEICLFELGRGIKGKEMLPLSTSC